MNFAISHILVENEESHNYTHTYEETATFPMVYLTITK